MGEAEQVFEERREDYGECWWELCGGGESAPGWEGCDGRDVEGDEGGVWGEAFCSWTWESEG